MKYCSPLFAAAVLILTVTIKLARSEESTNEKPTVIQVVPAATAAAAAPDTNKPIVLQSSGTHTPPTLPEAPRFPVHVIPEAITVQTPAGVFVFVDRVDVERLARFFPARRATNIVVYNR